MKQKNLMKSFSFILLFSLLFIHSICFGQNDWKSGCIIKATGDSVKGFIDNRDSKSNSKVCYFRKDENSQTQEFTPYQIAGYRLTNSKYFISKVVEGQNSGKPVFLEFLIQGKLNVYHYSDNEEYYYAEKELKIYELKSKEVTREIQGVTYIQQSNEYIGLLNYLLDDAHIQADINNSKLSAKSLIGIAKKYHEKVCKDESCIVYEMNVKPLHVVLGVHAGQSVNSLNFGDRSKTNFVIGNLVGFKVEFENAFSWKENFSFVIDFNLNSLNKCQLTSTSNNYSTTVNYNNTRYRLVKNLWSYSGQEETNRIDVDLKTYMLRIPLTLNYALSKGKVRPYIGLGIINTIVLSQNKDFIHQDMYAEYNQSIPTYQVGLVGRIGSKYMLTNKQALYAELNYEYSQNLNMNQFLRLSSNLISLTVGYAF